MTQIEELRRLEAKAVMLEQDRKAVERKLLAIGHKLQSEQRTLQGHRRDFDVVKEGLKRCDLDGGYDKPKLTLAISNAKAAELRRIHMAIVQQDQKIAQSKKEQSTVAQEYTRRKVGTDRVTVLIQSLKMQIERLKNERDYESLLEGAIGVQLFGNARRPGEKVEFFSPWPLSNDQVVGSMAKGINVASVPGTKEEVFKKELLKDLSNCEIQQLEIHGDISAVTTQQDFGSQVVLHHSLGPTEHDLFYSSGGNSGGAVGQDNCSSQESYQSLDHFKERITKLNSWQNSNSQGIQVSYLSNGGFQVDLSIDSSNERALNVVITLENGFEYNQARKERGEILTVLKEAGYLVRQIIVRKG